MTLPGSGQTNRAARLSQYREILDVTERNHIRMAIQADQAAFIFLSGKPANSIDYNTYFDYIELLIGGWLNTKSLIRVSTMGGFSGAVSTPNILNPHKNCRSFCLSHFGQFYITKLESGDKEAEFGVQQVQREIINDVSLLLISI